MAYAGLERMELKEVPGCNVNSKRGLFLFSHGSAFFSLGAIFAKYPSTPILHQLGGRGLSMKHQSKVVHDLSHEYRDRSRPMR